MQLITTKRTLATAATAFLLLFSLRSVGQTLSVSPDTITIQAAVGNSADSYFDVVNNNFDSLNPQSITVEAYAEGSSQITLVSDTILQFTWSTGVDVRYSPTSSSPTTAEIVVSYRGETHHVVVIGEPLSHSPLTALTGNYDLTINQSECQGFTVSNPNADSIWVTNVELINADQQNNVQWSLEDLKSLPFGIAGHAGDSMGELCAIIAAYDTNGNSGELRVVYSYGSGTDSTTVELGARVEPPNTSCTSTWGGDFGGLSIGQTATQTIQIENATDSAITLSSPEIEGTDAADFTIDSPSFPITIQPFDTASVTITFALPGNPSEEDYSAWFIATVTGPGPTGNGCSSVETALSGTWNVPITDSLTLDVPPGSSPLAIEANFLASRHAIFIQNDSTVGLTLETLSVATNDTTVRAFFTNTGNTSINIDDTIIPSETIGQYLLTLEASDTGSYNLDFTLTYETNGTSQKHEISSVPEFHYHVVAHVLPSAAASVPEPAIVSNASVSIVPNPANGPVDIAVSGAQKAKIEVFDLLGNHVADGAAAPSFTWNSASSANGTYIVRASGIDENGTPFVLSKRLSLVK